MQRTRRIATTAVAALLATVALSAAASSAWAAPAWLAPTDLTATGENASVPDVAMNAAGDAIVAWQRASGTGFFVQTSQRSAGTSFSAPLELGPAGFDTFGTPQAAIDAAGDAVVAWQQFEGLGLDIVVRAATRPAGGPFGEPETLSPLTGSSIHPQVATNAAGDTVVAWDHAVGDTVVVQAVVRPAGGTFTAPADLSAPAATGAYPRVAIDAAANATVVWTQVGASTSAVQVATRPAGGTFSAADDLAAPAEAGSARVATNAAGDTVAVWTGADASNSIVRAAIRPAGGTFSAANDLSAAGRDAGDPHVAVDASGRAGVVWTRFDGTSRVVQFAARPAGGPFSAAVNLSAAGGEALAPQIAVNPAGDTIAAWQRSDGANTIAQATLRRAGAAAFGPPTDLSLEGREAVAPHVAIDADGDAIAAWQRSDGANTIVQAAGHDGAGPQLRGLIVPNAVAAGTAANYALSPLDVWSPVASTVWSFDDGTTATGTSVSHAFAVAGGHTVTVTSTDALANATSATRTVTVTAPAAQDAAPPAEGAPPPPPACTDCRPHLPLLGSRIGYGAAVGRRYTVFTKLVVQPARAGTTIRLRCSGRGCPFTTRTRTVARLTPRLNLTKLVRGAKLRPGAELQVRVTRGDRIGTMATFAVRDRRRPRRIARCLYPGDERPAACP